LSNGEYVCAECYGDHGLKSFCADYSESRECDFCGATGREAIAAPLDEVVAHINACIHRHFDDPANAGLPYETREGGWQGITYMTHEVFDELGLDFPKDDDDRLSNAVSDGVDTDLWCDAEPFMLSPDQQLQFSWENFCSVIKHKRRYFFLEENKKKHRDEYDDILSPVETLRVIFSFAEEACAFVTMPAGTKFYRARYQLAGKVYKTAGELGPPPFDQAIQTNRMSPPGVVMTYVAEDTETALAETANASGSFAIGKFVSERDLLILDLTCLPEPPSVFAELSDSLEIDPRPRLRFLRAISYEISKPIARDDRMHVEYVPTQVVTEYVRTAVHINDRKVDGIRYASSRRHAATAIVLFADQSNLILKKEERPDFYFTDNRWLRLKKVDYAQVSRGDIKKWA